MLVPCATAIPVLKFKTIINSSEITCGYIPQMQSCMLFSVRQSYGVRPQTKVILKCNRLHL